VRRVAILGGGMAGLTAAWQLSRPECRDDFEVTVHQRGWRLGGKGASSRGAHGRIEEHGLHVWLGYYDNAFRLIQDVYAELDRPHADPSCPIPSWRDAFAPADRVGIGDELDGAWSHWLATFRQNPGVPGTARPADPTSVTARFVRRGLGLLADFSASLGDGQGAPGSSPRTPILSASSRAPRPRTGSRLGALDGWFRQAALVSVVGTGELLRLTERAGGDRAARSLVLGRLQQLSREVAAATRHSPRLSRSADLANLVLACLEGTIRDDLLRNPAGFAAVDHLDFREWLKAHGASERTLASPLIRGMYDLVFAYEGGDPARPRFAAGLGLMLSSRLFFDYQGSIFWHMQAGMGDIVFAPLYQALSRRGVRFEFFSRLDQLHLTPDRRSVGAITLGRQAELADGVDVYDPLVRVKGLPCYPSAPRQEQLARHVDSDLESHWSDRSTEVPVRLEQGVDFDQVVLATSIGMVRREDWTDEDAVRATAYFCGVLSADATPDPATADEVVRNHALQFLGDGAAHFWPGCRAANGGFRWALLAAPDDALGPARLDSQYWRANVDPSDQYVQSLPGSGASRLQADESGYDNLFLAGDWVNSGLNAGCIEAAVMAGTEAANAVRGRPLTEGLLGEWYGLRP
jgi:uncharacterized protein with NAD-binding domain and iron-sulfur cluster